MRAVNIQGSNLKVVEIRCKIWEESCENIIIFMGNTEIGNLPREKLRFPSSHIPKENIPIIVHYLS